MNQGHFTAMALAGDGEWYHFNDHRVRCVSVEQVASQEAYLLVYQKE